MVKVAICYLVDERPDVAVKAESPNGFTEDQLGSLMDAFIWLVKTRRGSEPAEPQLTNAAQPQPTAESEP